MRLTYEQVVKRLNSIHSAQEVCTNIERQAAMSWKNKFIDNSYLYGHQNGKYPPPMEIIRKYYPNI